MRVVETQNNNIDLTIALHDGEHCGHLNIRVEKACCSSPGESGYYECGCSGRDEIVCDNPNCDGIDEFEFEHMFERFVGGGSDCEE